MNPRFLPASLCLAGAVLTCGGCERTETGAPPSARTPETGGAATEPAAPPAPDEVEAAPTEEEPAGDVSAPPEPAEPQPETGGEAAAPALADDEPQTPPEPEAEPMTYGDLLGEIITDDGLVRYDLLAEPARKEALDAAVQRFAEAELPKADQERLALWCNAYNANVLLMVLAESRRPDFASLPDVDGFFDRRTITVAGETITLDALKNERIRPLGDPRIHAALVCGTMSCPPLRDEPYTADRLDEQLDDQCRRWVNDPTRFRMDEGKLGLSETLSRFGEDFRVAPYGNEIGFVLAWADPSSEMTRYIVNADRPQVRWLTRDWTLNQAPASPGDGD